MTEPSSTEALPRAIAQDDDGGIHAHVTSVRVYIVVFVALIFLTFLTVAVAGIHLGRANLAVAVVIASMKGALVCLFFMHLSHGNRFQGIMLVSALLFIGVFFSLTMNDTSYRHDYLVDRQSGAAVDLKSGAKAPGGWEPVSEKP